jgi:hypothetical protein
MFIPDNVRVCTKQQLTWQYCIKNLLESVLQLHLNAAFAGFARKELNTMKTGPLDYFRIFLH